MNEIYDYETARRRAESTARLQSVLRIAMAIVVVIFLGLAYSLSYVQPGEAEYVISILTLVLNTLLFGGVLTAAIMLKKRRARCEQLMRAFAAEDRADPWIVH